MSPSFRRAAFAATLLLFGVCPIASAQISLGIGRPADHDAEARILRQLESRDSFVFKEMPLTAFVQLLRDRFGINVVIDMKALEDFGIDTETPISVHLQDVTLHLHNLFLLPIDPR